MPVSLIFFVLTAGLFVAQLVPLLGVFLMMFAAAYWSVILVNLGFIGIAIETLQKRVSPGWLALPILWFGGYLVAAGVSDVSAHLTDLEFRRENAGKRIAFASSSQSIVIAPSEDGASLLNGDQFAREMVLLYGVQPVYVPNPNVGPGHLAYRRREEPERCATAMQRLSIDCPSHKPFGHTDYAPERPWRPKVLVQIGATSGSYEAHHMSVPIRVTNAAGQSVELVAGAVQPLSWWPQPILGCGLNSNAGRWQCTAGFGHGKWRGLGGEYINGPAAAGVLADALGLTEVAAL